MAYIMANLIFLASSLCIVVVARNTKTGVVDIAFILMFHLLGSVGIAALFAN
ncbi:TMhelix containing protein [Vibrio phage 1.095.O._10N.286.46.E10]|uniref:TMhelix containing protein n=1 Tax=Vibrio phage 1.095.O._10N.286.46.E10 TaxID=1881401 RepID=A0A2I7R0G5_9VIRU|nr:TMhelix containing protein [Vibrio phage 1.095.O._10N.286.46.E10]